MGIEDAFAHTLILGGAFLYAGCLIGTLADPIQRVAGYACGTAMLIVGLVDRIADHL